MRKVTFIANQAKKQPTLDRLTNQLERMSVSDQKEYRAVRLEYVLEYLLRGLLHVHERQESEG